MLIDGILAEDFGVDALSAKNKALQSYYTTQSRLDKFLRPDIYIGGGHDSDSFNYTRGDADQASSSVYVAQQYNDNHVKVIHGGLIQQYNGQTVELGSVYKAAIVMGRVFGLPPQIPATAKSLSYLRDVSGLTAAQETVATRNGVIITKRGPVGGFEILRDINTLQQNSSLFMRNGESYDGTITSMSRFTAKQLKVTLRSFQFNRGPVGGANRANFSPAEAEEAVKDVLNTLVASPTADNVLIRYSNVRTVAEADAYKTEVRLQLNTPVNFHFVLAVIS